MANFEKIENISDIRRNLGLNQMEFWSKLGVTQSGGSRYESGRNMPKPVRELLRIVHIERVDLSSINASDLAVASLLKERDPELYEQLLSDSQQKNQRKPKSTPPRPAGCPNLFPYMNPCLSLCSGKFSTQ